MSASNTSNSSSVISPSSTRICAASSCSRSAVSSFSLRLDGRGDLVEHEADAADQERVDDDHGESTPNATPNSKKTHDRTSLWRLKFELSVRPLQLEADVDEVVRRPGPRVLEGQLVVARADVLDARVEGLLGVARDQEGGVHDHPVADRLVRS